MGEVKKEMLIANIVSENPEVIEVFLEYGLHCVSCHISGVETLEEGAARHGMDENTINMMIKDANQVISENLNLIKEKPVWTKEKL